MELQSVTPIIVIIIVSVTAYGLSTIDSKKAKEIKNYFIHNPFFYWAIFSLFLKFTHSFTITEYIRTALWVNYLYLTILFPLITINFFMIIPYRSIYDYTRRNKISWGYALFFAITLAVVISFDSVVFFVDIMETIGDQHPEVIKDHDLFGKLIIVTEIMVFSIPLLNNFTLMEFKNLIERIPAQFVQDRVRRFNDAYPIIFTSFIIPTILVILMNR